LVNVLNLRADKVFDPIAREAQAGFSASAFGFHQLIPLALRGSSDLRAKAVIITIAAAVIILTWIFVSSQIRYERREAIASGLRANINRVIALEQYVIRTLDEAQLAIDFVAYRYNELFLEPSGEKPVFSAKQLADIAYRSPALRKIAVFDARGDLVATTIREARPNFSAWKIPAFQSHRANRNTAPVVNPLHWSPIFRQ